jgi:hypothetical protein
MSGQRRRDSVDVPGLRTVDGLAEVEGNTRRRAASASGRHGSGTARAISSASAKL